MSGLDILLEQFENENPACKQLVQDGKKWQVIQSIAVYFGKWTWFNGSTLALMIEESMKFTRQNPLQSYKVPHQLKFLGNILDNACKSTEKLVVPILAVAKKYGATIAKDGLSDQCYRPILSSSERNSVGLCCKDATKGMVWDVCEALAPWASNVENVCSLSSYFSFLVQAKLIHSQTYPDKDQQQAEHWNYWETCLCLLEQQDGSNFPRCQQAQDVCLG